MKPLIPTLRKLPRKVQQALEIAHGRKALFPGEIISS